MMLNQETQTLFTSRISQNKTFSSRLHWFAILMMGCLFAWLLSKGVVIDVDSPSYITKGFLRSPLYPLLIHLSQGIFGEGVLYPVIALQLFLLGWAAYQLTKQLEKYFEISPVTFYIVLGTLILPFCIKWGNFLLSQGLAYPLFLFSVSLFFQALFEKKSKPFIYSFIMLTLLILTRRQFMFMYVVFGAGILYFWMIHHIKLRKIALLCFALLASFIAADLAEKSYHYAVNGHFTTVPHLGMQFIVAPLYLASESDAALFSDPIERAIFTESYKNMQEKCLNAECAFKGSHPPYQHFYLHYNNIGWGVLWPVAIQYTQGNLPKIDELTLKISFKLILNNWQRWVKLYLGNIVNNIGGYYFAFWLCLIFAVSFFSHLKNKDRFSIGLFFTILMTFGNYSLIALVEPAMAPYNFYTNTVLFCFLIILIMKYLRKSFQLDNNNNYA